MVEKRGSPIGSPIFKKIHSTTHFYVCHILFLSKRDSSYDSVDCCLFRPAFGCFGHMKAGQSIFWWFSNLFCSFQPSAFFGWKEEKRSKKCFFIDSLKLIHIQSLVDSLSLRGYTIILKRFILDIFNSYFIYTECLSQHLIYKDHSDPG